MALFSVVGLVMLWIAGQRIEERIGGRLQRRASEVQSATGDPDSPTKRRDYSLAAVRWILAGGAVAGLGWSVWATRNAPPGQMTPAGSQRPGPEQE